MNWPTYESHKSAGQQWLGRVPKHWRIENPKRLFTERREPARSEDRQLTASQSDGVVFQDEYMEERGTRVVQVISGQSGLRHVCSGDFVISLRSFQGGIEYSPYSGKISPAYTILMPSSGIDRSFFRRLLKSESFIQELRSTSNQLRDGQSMNMDHLSQVLLPVPPLEEQRAISRFLDANLARIDSLVSKQEELIATLREERAATITHAVTRGSVKTAQLTEPDFPFIGKIPAHWQLLPLKRCISLPLAYGANESAISKDPRNPRYIRITDIDSNGNLKEETFRSLPAEVAAPYLLADGDVLLARSGTVGKSFLYKNEFGQCCFAGYLIKATPNNEILTSQFLKYFTESLPYWHQIYAAQTQSTIQNVSAERYGNIVIPIPPVQEQREIADHLSTNLLASDQLVSNAEELINTLNQYRSALITAAVTGQIDVREAA